MNAKFFNNKKKKFLPILSLKKNKNLIEKRFYNKSFNSILSSDYNSFSLSSKKIRYSNNSGQSVKPYNTYISKSKQINNIQQECSDSKNKKPLLINISGIKNKKNNNLKEKFLKLYDDNKNNILLLDKKKPLYQKTYTSNHNKNSNLFNTPLNKNMKLKHIYYSKKKIMPIKKNNNTILKKFEGDFHNFYLNSLQRTKDEFFNKMFKINKTFYQCSISKNEQLIKNLKKQKIDFYSNRKKNKNNFYLDKNKKLDIEEDSYISGSTSRSKNILENKLIKTKYSSQLLKINKNYKRKRNFKQYMDEKNILGNKWKKKLDVIETNTYYNPLLINDLKFQSGIIKDELCLLLDDLQHFRFIFFEDPYIFSAFKNKDIKYQIKLNKIVEETCALLHLIPKIILKEYYYYTDKFISIVDPSMEFFSKKIVYNEAECFQDNLKYLYKILNFVNCCDEVYSQLIEQVEDEMIITLQNFNFLRAILDKLRHYIINLTNICKNILKDYIFDKQIIEKFKDAIKKSKEDNKNKIKDKDNNTRNNNKNDEKPELNDNSEINFENDSNKNLNFFSKTNERRQDEIDNIKISKKLNLGENFLSQKINRIAKALEANNTPNKKEIKKGLDSFKEKQAKITAGASGPMALINSTLMTKMLKYIKKDYKKKIISLRTSERFVENKI